MSISSLEHQYQELKTELKICKIGGLFLAVYCNKEVPKLIINKLENDNDLKGLFQFSLYMDEKKVPFPILFEQTFEQMGNKNNIYHVLDVEENLSSEAAKEFLRYLQYARERFKAKPYSIVFWITPEFEKELFFQAPDFHHWIFETYDFTDVGDEELKSLTYSKNNELFDVQKIDKYLEKVIWQYENWEAVKNTNESFLLEPMERADLFNYYIQSYCTDKEGKTYLLDDFLTKFIEESTQSSLIGLGDFGTGKSSFSIHYFIKTAKQYLDDNNNRIPIFISLKDYRGKLDIEDFIVNEFCDKFNININLLFFQQLALEGKFIFFIDGFDEMGSLTDREITIQNLKELTKLSFENVLFMTKAQDQTYEANKVFLTSRTHYFLTESQEQDILKADYTILYRNYATKSNYEITRIKLKEFNDNQIREYIQKHTNNQQITDQYLKIIEDTYNLKDLSTRPLLLDMIIKTIDKFKEQKNISTSDLYRAYTNIWIERDDWRSQMTPKGKRHFMWEMATKMFKLSGDFSLHYSNLNKPKDENLKSNFDRMDQDYYKYESTTCTFLNRDANGNYKFIHKSFMEYFVAESFYSQLRKDNPQMLYYSSFNKEIKHFLKHIITLHKDELDARDLRNFELSQINLSYRSFIQANLSGSNLRDSDLNGANLSGAKLNNSKLILADLSNADLILADLSNADLILADLSNADLSNADLSNADLSSADLSNADLSNADLSNSKLNSTDLTDADLTDANLTNADLNSAKLNKAKLNSANLSEAKLNNVNMSGACLINIKNSTSYQIKSAGFWDKAIYKWKWDNRQEKWIVDEQANQQYIEELRQIY